MNNSVTYTPKLALQVLLYDTKKEQYFADVIELNMSSLPYTKPTAIALIHSHHVFPKRMKFIDVISCDLTYTLTYHDTRHPEIIEFQHEYFVKRKLYETLDI